MSIKEQILKDLNITEILPSDIASVPSELEGDYSIPCFKLAKLKQKSPALIATEICNETEVNGIVAKMIPVGPYINIVLNKSAVANHVYNNIHNNEHYGVSDIGKGQTVCIDYSSITLSKHIHIGHLCTTVIGECLAKLYENAGYKVVRINYLGDMGTPFGKIIAMYKLKGNKEEVEKNGVDEIQRLYALFAKEEDNNPELIEEARLWSLKVEKGDKEANELCEWFKSIALDEAKRMYQLLDIDFDDWRGEYYYSEKTEEVMDLLEQKGLVVVSEGAKCIDLNKFNMGMCLVERSDGGSLYTTRDLAAAIDRYNCYNFNKSLYVTGIEQKHHFESFFKVLDLAGFEWAKDLVHVGYGRLSTEFGKISGREGNTPVMKDIFEASIEKAKKALEGKNLSEDLATDIGVSAVAFSVLKTERIKDAVFSLEQAISFDGNSSVYIQYSYVRLKSILNKAKEYSINTINPELLKETEELELLVQLDEFPEVLKEALMAHETFYVTRYALDLAALVNKFYNNLRVVTDDEELTQSRLALCAISASVLAKAMKIVGVKVIEKM